MDGTPLYQQIAESVRQEILYGTLQPGDNLPSVREMANRHNCTPGTVQRAYKELAQQGLISSRPGQGTRVIGALTARDEAPLRRANLVHRAESFLLEVLTAGYAPSEVEEALRLALDRWRALAQQPAPPASQLRFAGSHDPAIALIASRFSEIAPGHTLHLTFAGSLGGFIALIESKADISGSHLWDEESNTYNRPFVQRLLPGHRVALLTLAHRRLGLLTPPGNPAAITTLADLARPGLRFVNRQRGAGTRVWLDTHLHHLGIATTQIPGYEDEALTHSEVAQAIAEGRADAGLGIEAAALAYGLGFVYLTQERYDLVIPAAAWETAPVQALARWLATPPAQAAIANLGGYDIAATGEVIWVD